MTRLLIVCAGGALGSGARYLVGTWAIAALGVRFPWGTLAVNVVGSALLGAIMTASLVSSSLSQELRLFLGAGIMGGFTTYSSFNWEVIALATEGRWAAAAGYLAATVVLCLAAGLLGVAAVHGVAG